MVNSANSVVVNFSLLSQDIPQSKARGYIIILHYTVNQSELSIILDGFCVVPPYFFRAFGLGIELSGCIFPLLCMCNTKEKMPNYFQGIT